MKDINNRDTSLDTQNIVEIKNLIKNLTINLNVGPNGIGNGLNDKQQAFLLQLDGYDQSLSISGIIGLLQAQLNALQAEFSLNPVQRNLVESLRKGESIDSQQLKTVGNPITHLGDYFFKRYGYWRRTKLDVNEHFVNLSLWLDQGKEDQNGRFGKMDICNYHNLEDLLEGQKDPLAFILIGRPGNGKSTLLQHLEQCLCENAIKVMPEGAQQSAITDQCLPIYAELNQYPPKEEAALSPLEWLENEWASKSSPRTQGASLPSLTELLQTHHVVLLLDALNEMRIPGDEHGQKLLEWREFLKTLNANYPNTRVIFSCRTADYGGELSEFDGLKVPQIRIDDISDTTIEEYLKASLPSDWEPLYQQLIEIKTLELKTPFYLSLAVKQYVARGHRLSKGTSDLIAGMIWLALKRENTDKGHIQLEILQRFFSKRSLEFAQQNKWLIQPHCFPDTNIFINGLTQIAWNIQNADGGGRQGRRHYDELKQDLVELFDTEEALDAFLKLAHDLDVLQDSDLDAANEHTSAITHSSGYKFQHHLLQEYLAAHELARSEKLAMLAKPWRRDEVTPSLNDKIQNIGISEPLPMREQSGWEETALHAVAITHDAEGFIARVAEQDLVLAARCAQHPEIVQKPAFTDGEFKHTLQQQLLSLSYDPEADLRTCLEAGTQLGYLGDPRFTLVQKNNQASYILPSLACIPAGSYPIGSDTEDKNEKPKHQVNLAAFEMAKYPVTNAEWACFIDAGGYEDESLWQTNAAGQWQRGELESTERKEQLISLYNDLRENFDEACQRRNITQNTREIWEKNIEKHSKIELEEMITRECKAQTYRQPGEWNNPRFNAPTQPVVGISWYEAGAYCAWLSRETGQHFGLPSEAQWEAAAAGPKGRRYPWGKEDDKLSNPPRANTDQWHLRQTSPVGLFRAGATPETGLYDMGGNVWEWTSSLGQKYPILDGDSRDHPEQTGSRIIRGGAWGGLAEDARAACRSDTIPDNRNDGLGFRVVLFPPSSDH